MEAVIFYTTSAILIGSGILFMSSNKMVHSIFYCFITFISLAAIFLILDAPFIAAAQIFIYGGAVTVLILFVVMLTTTDVHGRLRNIQSGWSFLVIVFFGTVLAYTMLVTKWSLASKTIKVGTELMDAFSKALFTKYYLTFEVAGILLLAALVGAIYLAREKE